MHAFCSLLFFFAAGFRVRPRAAPLPPSFPRLLPRSPPLSVSSTVPSSDTVVDLFALFLAQKYSRPNNNDSCLVQGARGRREYLRTAGSACTVVLTPRSDDLVMIGLGEQGSNAAPHQEAARRTGSSSDIGSWW